MTIEIEKTEHDQTMIGLIRRLAINLSREDEDGACLSAKETADMLGVFRHPDSRITTQLLGNFFTGLLDKIVLLESEIGRGVRISADKYRKKTDGLERLSDLVTFLSQALYSPEDSKEQRQRLLSLSTDAAGKFSQISRYNLELGVFKFAPHDRQGNGKGTNYKFDDAATVKLKLSDKHKGESLILDFFPVRYSWYDGHHSLSGASPELAAEVLREQKQYRRSGDFNRVSTLIQNGKDSTVNPHFRLAHLDSFGNELIAIRGELQEIDGQLGLVTCCEELDEFSVFLPLPRVNGIKNKEEIMVLLAQGLTGLELKTSLKEPNHKRKKHRGGKRRRNRGIRENN